MAAQSNLLLDTHVLLWWLAGSSRLPSAVRRTISTSPAVYVSSASVWEIAIKIAHSKLEFHGDLEDQLRRNRFQPLSISISHALAAAALPPHHNDPFDRMLVAQARIESLTLVTHDSRMAAYDVPLLSFS